MDINRLLEHRLIFVAGKGGVGRTTIAAALAVAAARMGKRVCLVESDGQEQMARLFQARGKGHEREALAPNIRGVSLTLEDALKEFISRRLPLHTISHRLINNRLVRYFLDATPGLKELLTLGTISDLTELSRDEIFIVDLPATGHGLAMLSVPDVVIRAVHAGPLRHHAEKTRALLNDPETSAVCFVSLAEELAAQETVELYESISKNMTIAVGPVVANGVHLPPFDADERKHFSALKRKWEKDPELARLIEGGELALARAELNERYLKRLEESFGKPPLIVPFLFVEAIDRDSLVQISEFLTEEGSS